MKKLLTFLLLIFVFSVNYAQEAYLLDFLSEQRLKSDVSFSVGPAFSLAPFSGESMYSDLGENALNSAKLGLRAEFKFNHYFVPYVGFGLMFGGEILGFDPANLENFMRTKYSTSLDRYQFNSSTGWRALHFGGSINFQLPLIRGLFLTSSINVNYQIVQSPSIHLSRPIAGMDTTKRDAFFSKSNNGQIVVSASIGAKYRHRKHIHLFADLHFINATYAIRPDIYSKDEKFGVFDRRKDFDFAQVFSVLSLMVGVNYSF